MPTNGSGSAVDAAPVSPAPAELHDVLTVDEVAALLRLNRKTVYEAIARREMPARRIGTAYRLSRSAVLDWLRGQDRVAGARSKR
jgi:excisionase family DNA binding protein